MMSKHVVIIGNGIAGVTAARFIRKLSDFRITMISAETDHFYARTALMYIYMGHLRYRDTKPYEDDFWSKNRIDLVRGYVTRIDTDNKEVHVGGGRALGYDVLLRTSYCVLRIKGTLTQYEVRSTLNHVQTRRHYREWDRRGHGGAVYPQAQ